MAPGPPTANVSARVTDNPESANGGVNKKAASISANLLYSPVPELTFGVELMHAIREFEDGTDGSMDRLQFSARYNFGYVVSN